MTFNLTIRLFLMTALCSYFWDITLGGSQTPALQLTNVTLQEIRELDSEDLKDRRKRGEDIAIERLYQAYYYKGLPHSSDMTIGQHLQIVRYRLIFGPRLAAVPILSAFGNAVSYLLPFLKDDIDRTGYRTGVLILTALAIPAALVLHLDKGKRPVLAWSGTLAALFLFLQLMREFSAGNPLNRLAYFLIFPVLLFSAWKLLSQYSQA